MQLLEMNMHSKILERNVSLNILLPQTSNPKRDRYPVLWLLHSAGGDHTIWLRRTAVERYAEHHEIAVVMPSARLSMYTNMAHGGRYFDFIAKELPELLTHWLPISKMRNENFIAGASMGGYGAMKIGLSRPERYASIGCFSAGNLYEDKYQVMSNGLGRNMDRRNEAVFGMSNTKTLKNSEHDLESLYLTACNDTENIPDIYLSCGINDPMLPAVRELKNDLYKNAQSVIYYKESNGRHDWAYWDKEIEQYMERIKNKMEGDM